MLTILLQSNNPHYQIDAKLTIPKGSSTTAPPSYEVKDATGISWILQQRQTAGMKSDDVATITNFTALPDDAAKTQEQFREKMVQIYTKYFADPQFNSSSLTHPDCSGITFTEKSFVPLGLLSLTEHSRLEQLINQSTLLTKRMQRPWSCEAWQKDISQFMRLRKGPTEETTLLRDSAPTSPAHQSPANKYAFSATSVVSQDFAQLKLLGTLTEGINTEAKKKRDYAVAIAIAALFADVLTLVSTATTPSCTDIDEKSHQHTTLIWHGVTCGLTATAALASFRNRSTTVPDSALLTKEFTQTSVLSDKELASANLKTPLQFPSWLLPQSARCIRENMQFLAWYQARQAILKARPLDPSADATQTNVHQTQCAKLTNTMNLYQEAAQVVSIFGVTGMLAMVASAIAEGALAVTGKQIQLCNSSSTVDASHDERLDLTTKDAFCFCLPLLGCGLLIADRMMKRPQTQYVSAQTSDQLPTVASRE